MNSFIAFACLGSLVWLGYIWWDRRHGFSADSAATMVPIALVSLVSAVVTMGAMQAHAPTKEVQIWHSAIYDVRTANEMTPMGYTDLGMMVKYETSYGFSYDTSAGVVESVRIMADKDTRVIVDDTLACDEATWTVYRVVVDEDWLFHGWTMPGHTVRLINELRVSPGMIDGE